MRPRQLNMESVPINEQLLKATQNIQELEAKVKHLEVLRVHLNLRTKL